VAFLVFLALESATLEGARRKIPLRIAVAGTRGKSGVARLIAAGLRESGAVVVAKTTGSRPVLIFPDGSEEEIPRAGMPSIREQVRTVRRAAAAGAGAVVAEMMSIGAECLRAESERILRPGILALTNVRLDHLDAMGRTREDIAATLAGAIPEDGVVFFPAEEFYPAFGEAARRLRSRLSAAEGTSGGDVRLPFGEFEPNVRLALAVLESLGVGRETAVRGMGRAVPDFGSLRMWTVPLGPPSRAAVCVSAFAANDPESSAAVLARMREIVPAASGPLVGFLSLREDRGDRTLQWVRAAVDGFFGNFESVAVFGRPAPAAARKMKKMLGRDIGKFSFFTDPEPAILMDFAATSTVRDAVIIGFGNIVGPGEQIIRYWEERGRPFGR